MMTNEENYSKEVNYSEENFPDFSPELLEYDLYLYSNL